MQVATLFRESAATLLGATTMNESTAFAVPSSQSLDLHPVATNHEGYKILSPSLRADMPDDGYETSVGDTLPRVVKAPPDDPYNFIDDDLSHMMSFPFYGTDVSVLDIPATVAPKKRGRKKKPRDESTTTKVRERKKHDRFNGMSEEEVSKRTLPDHIANNLDIIIIGINPGLFAAYKGHHYAGPGNHFWKCLYLSGLTHEQMTAEEDYKLLKFGIGFTNMVQRATKGSADLTRKEIKEGSHILMDKLKRFRPKIAVFNGKLIFEVFSGKKDFNFGRQPECIEGTNTYMWVMPSSSARCAQLPRAADKVPFYAALKKFRDYLNGVATEAELDEQEFVFSDPKYKVCCESEPKMDNCVSDIEVTKKKRGRPKKVRPEDAGDAVIAKAILTKRTIALEGVAKKKRGRPKKLREGETVEATFSSPPSIIETMHNFCKTSTAYQSPQNSQTYSHSDLSSEISAAISSDHLVDSPPAGSPPLGPPDFEPPATMPTDGASQPDLSRYSPYAHPYSQDEWRTVREQRDIYKMPDVTTKSLSGLENLVDQIPAMREIDVAPALQTIEDETWK
ncbi:uncharacterized protein LOC132257057 isoform X2 [Phlebotomus argentipes]|uniref:uncharacterized protein LOC132257057 isoform X2 n=1 Tax=Phlebotomus argentipes TaxID=94469 RepID=UPI0028929A88|nr:uncharacterized protein LOC132257057 isoform X2 [Phlebotomus argentipes]